MGCITVPIKMISWALCNVTIDLALHTLHNQHRSISDHMYKVDNTNDNALHTLHNQHRSISDMYKVDNTHDNNTSHTPSEDTDQLWHPPNRIRAFAVHVKKFKP